jgi:hypothetical protein
LLAGLLERSARRSEPVPDWRRPTGKCIKEDLAPLQDLNKDSVVIITNVLVERNESAELTIGI